MNARSATSAWDGWLVPAALVLLALVVRVWALRFEPWVTIDGTEYIGIAEAMRRGEALPSIFPPGYPVLIALARFVVWDRVAAASSVSLVCGALLIWPVWLLARRAVGPRWALVPALAVALHPGLVEASTWTMSESAYFLALFLGLAFADRPLASGLAMGAAFAMRPEALLPAAALGIVQLGRLFARTSPGAGTAPTSPRRPNPNRLAPALFALGFLMLATPCWLLFRSTLGTWTLTPKVAAAVRTPGRTWVQDEPKLASSAPPERYDLVERLVRNGPDVLRQYPGRALAFGKGLVLMWPVTLLLLSLWGFVRRRGLEAIPLMHLLLLPMFALGMQPRFLLVAIPALAILAAVPLRDVTRRGVRIAIALLWVAGFVWCAVASWNALKTPFDGHSGAQKEAGEWLRAVAEPDATVMDRRPHLAFYASRSYRVMPDEPYDVLLDAAVAQGVRYFVVDEGVARVFRRQILPLLYDPALRARESRLEMVYAGGHHKEYGVSIFRVLRPGEAKTGRPPEFRVHWFQPKGS